MVCNVLAAVFFNNTWTHAHIKDKYYPIDQVVDEEVYREDYGNPTIGRMVVDMDLSKRE